MADQDLASGTLEQLRAVLALVDAGELAAEPLERAHLAGAVDVLERLVDGTA